MSQDRFRSIQPMFGGATSYVETLIDVLEFAKTQQPTTEEFVDWHRRRFQNVSSEDGIRRQINYLKGVGFLDVDGEQWTLGEKGREYFETRSTDILLDTMCRRNVGLRSLLYALRAGPMTIEDIGQQQLRTHSVLGWNPSKIDMPRQRANWLRSFGLVQREGDEYTLTDEGWRFTESAIDQWADGSTVSAEHNSATMASTYETTVQARSVDPEFRATILERYDATCPVSGVDCPALLDVAHILSWSEYPDYRADPANVLPLSKTHHAAFDHGLFTIDQEYQLQVNPEFTTGSEILRKTIVDKDEKAVSFSDQKPNAEYLSRYNEGLNWFTT